MNNRGWVGILFLIIFLSVLSIGIFGFIIYKYSKNLNLVSFPDTKISEFQVEDSKVTLANKVVTTLPTTLPQTLPSENSKTYPSVFLTKPQGVMQTQPQFYDSSRTVSEECFKFAIDSGDLKSNKCYVEEDYNQIQNLYSDYKFQLGSIDFIESRIEITCDGSEFFKSSCDDATRDLANQKKLIENLKSKIKTIISRGK